MKWELMSKGILQQLKESQQCFLAANQKDEYFSLDILAYDVYENNFRVNLSKWFGTQGDIYLSFYTVLTEFHYVCGIPGIDAEAMVSTGYIDRETQNKMAAYGGYHRFERLLKQGGGECYQCYKKDENIGLELQCKVCKKEKDDTK